MRQASKLKWDKSFEQFAALISVLACRETHPCVSTVNLAILKQKSVFRATLEEP